MSRRGCLPVGAELAGGAHLVDEALGHGLEDPLAGHRRLLGDRPVLAVRPDAEVRVLGRGASSAPTRDDLLHCTAIDSVSRFCWRAMRVRRVGVPTNVSELLGARRRLYQHLRRRRTATSHYPADHGGDAGAGATVTGFTVGYGRAAGVLRAGAVICSVLIHHEAGLAEPLDEIVSGLV
jgi:hypothetical protein